LLEKSSRLNFHNTVQIICRVIVTDLCQLIFAAVL